MSWVLGQCRSLSSHRADCHSENLVRTLFNGCLSDGALAHRAVRAWVARWCAPLLGEASVAPHG